MKEKPMPRIPLHTMTPQAQAIFANLGSRIKAKRKQLSLSQDDLAAAAGLNRAYISQIECGRQNMTVNVLTKIGIALGYDLIVGFQAKEELKEVA